MFLNYFLKGKSFRKIQYRFCKSNVWNGYQPIHRC